MLKVVLLALASAQCLVQVSGLAVETEGGFHTVKGLAFYQTSAYSAESLPSHCGYKKKCRTVCAEASDCLMFASYHVQDSYYCNLYTSTPYQMGLRPLNYNDSSLSIKVVAPGAVYDARDGYMYWLGSTLMNMTQAHKDCLSKTGYRLGIYKQDIQVEILQHFYSLSGGTDSILISLVKDPSSGSPVWGDGTPYVATGAYASLIVNDGGASSSVYGYGLSGKINDLPATYHGYVLCQGTPYLTPIL